MWVRDDDVFEWAQDRESIFLPLNNDIQEKVMEVLGNHPRLMGQRANRNHADPFVIATAYARCLTVVTEEDAGSASKPRIPFVCNAYGIECVRLLDLIHTEGWVF